MTETVELVVLAAGTAGIAGVVGALVVRALRATSIGTQTAAVALVAVLAVGVGAWAGARAMFLSQHDLGALTVMLVAAGAVGVTTSLLLGRRVGQASDDLARATRRLGDGGVVGDAPRPAPAELSRLRHELEETSRRLDEARARERALDVSRRELVAWVSHDLRTPLAGIRAVVEALEDGVVDDPETVARYHTTVREEADRLAALVDDLFELSRTQAGVLQLEIERVTLGDLVSDAIASAAPVAEAKGVHLEGHLDGSPVLAVSASEVLRALRNILENAIRHTPSDGSVIVEGGLDADNVYVSVVDTGGGIPEHDLPRIFDVAFRGDRARTPGEGGAGLGLAIARGLVEAHRGEITVRNQNGGACFTVRLPAAAAG
jgi:signal transduction histidine kinase